MHSQSVVLAACLLVASSCLSFAQAPAKAVSYLLQMGRNDRQNYTCVFSGTVRCHGGPCAGARVQVDVVDAHEQAATLNVNADSQGRYLARLNLVGAPNEMATWTLSAQAAPSLEEVSGVPAEVEGHAILMEEETVLVERPLDIEEP